MKQKFNFRTLAIAGIDYLTTAGCYLLFVFLVREMLHPNADGLTERVLALAVVPLLHPLIHRLFGVYRTLYREHADFIRFVGDFDDFVIRTQPPQESLREYEASVLNFFPVFLGAYEAGLGDGTVREIADPRLFYDSVCHGVMALTQKLLRGEILAADGFGDSAELDLLLDMAARYLQKGE